MTTSLSLADQVKERLALVLEERRSDLIKSLRHLRRLSRIASKPRPRKNGGQK